MAVAAGSVFTVLARQTQLVLSVTAGVERAQVPAGHGLMAAAVAGAACATYAETRATIALAARRINFI